MKETQCFKCKTLGSQCVRLTETAEKWMFFHICDFCLKWKSRRKCWQYVPLPQKNHRQNLLGNEFHVHLKIVFVWSPTIFFLSLFELVLNDLTAENLPTDDKLISAKYANIFQPLLSTKLKFYLVTLFRGGEREGCQLLCYPCCVDRDSVSPLALTDWSILRYITLHYV